MWTIASINEDPGIWRGNTLVEFHLPAPNKVNEIPTLSHKSIVKFSSDCYKI